MNATTTLGSGVSSTHQRAALCKNTADLAALWTESRLAYPLYATLAKQFELASLPHPPDELPPVRPTRAIFDRDLKWLDEIDEKLFAFQIRQVPSEILNQSEDNLRAFIQRQLQRPNKGASDRDKIDLLLVQYFAQCAPEQLYRQEIELEDVAQVLEPVLRESDATPLDWCEPLNGILNVLNNCRSLRDLLEAGLLEQGRMVKDAAGSNYYETPALVAFCRFNFLLRRAFIRLLHADLGAVREAIGALEASGTRTADCRRAGLSAAETTAELRRFCENWRQPFQKDYTENSVNASFEQLLALRADLEEAIARKSNRFQASREAAHGPSGHSSSREKSSFFAGASFAADSSAEESTETRDSEPGALRDRDHSGSDTPIANSSIRQSTIPEAAWRPKPKIDFEGSATDVAHAEQCLEIVWEQLRGLPPSGGRAMSTIVLHDTKVLLSSWEGEAFTGEESKTSEDMRRAVLARALLSVAMDRRKRSGEENSLSFAVAHARREASYFQGRIEHAKQCKNAEAAVNLAISAKRLLATVQEAEKLQA